MAALQLARNHGARNVRVFGSLARGEHSPSSDIDFLVDLDPDRTLMDLGGLLMDLQEMLELRVDVEAPEGIIEVETEATISRCPA